jgi:hypothetical protein
MITTFSNGTLGVAAVFLTLATDLGISETIVVVLDQASVPAWPGFCSQALATAAQGWGRV